MFGFCSKGYDIASAEQGVERDAELDADTEDIIDTQPRREMEERVDYCHEEIH